MRNPAWPIPYTPPLIESDWIYSFPPSSTDPSPTTTCDPSLRYTANSGRVFCAKLDADGNPCLPIGYWEDYDAITAGALPSPAQEYAIEQFLEASYGAPIARPDMLAAYTAAGFNWLAGPKPYTPLVYPVVTTVTPPIQGAPVVYPVYTPSGSIIPGQTPTTTTPTTPTTATTPTTPTTTTPTAADVYQSSGLKPKFLDAGGAGGGVGTLISSVGSIALSFIPVIGGFLGGLLGGLLGGGTDLSGVIKSLNSLQQQIHDLSDTMTQFTWSVANGLGDTIQAFAEVWDNFFDAVWTYLKQLWKLLWSVVDTIIPALIKGLRDLRKLVDTVFQKYIVPALKYLQKIRLVLEILKALHIPFATKLDQILGKISGALFAPMYYVLRMLNANALWTNFILAWDLTIQRPLFLRTMQKYQGDWIAMWWNAQAANLPAAAGSLPPPAGGPPSNASEISAVQQYARTGTGPYASIAAQAQVIVADINTPI